MTPLKINNRDARRLWLDCQGLSKTPTGPLDVMATIRQLGFVQLDTIQYVSRAHHHILWSRNQNYREPMLDKLLGKDRLIFEHFTHDASVLPIEYYPVWKRQMRRKAEAIGQSDWYSSRLDKKGCDEIKARIASEGPLSTHAFDTKIVGKKEPWARPPHKLALDYMWYSGELATCHRKNFNKFYDLSEKVIPEDLHSHEMNDADQLNHLCMDAITRLGFGTIGDIKRFWDAVDTSEAKAWTEENQDALVPVEIEGADKQYQTCFGAPDIEERLKNLPAPSSRLRILNPFDPVIRDRNRLKRLFGIDYRIEIFVPKAKRQWGYYVYPLLEGDRIVGRIEVKAERAKGTLNVLGFWPEPKIKWTTARNEKLDAELERLARFVGVETINWLTGR